MKRLTVVDSLRGFSLLGILFANLLIFQFGITGAKYPDFYGLNMIDKVLLYINHILIHDSAMPIFLLLFGFGLVKMSESLTRQNKSVKLVLIRRGIILFVLGLLHAFFLFNGDILSLYGCMLICLFWLVRRNIKIMYGMIGLCIVIILCMGLISYDSANTKQTNGHDNLSLKQEQFLNKEIKVYKYGNASERRAFFHEENYPFTTEEAQLSTISAFVSIFYIPIFFILGMIFAKNNFFSSNNSKFLMIMIILMPVFLLFKGLMLFYPQNAWIADLGSISTYAVSLSYISLFMLKYNKFSHIKVFSYFESVGKLSLTNYISQSLFHAWVYYGFGLHRFGDNNFILSIIIATCFFALQMFTSHKYLKHFKFGPLEYLVRIVSYWSLHPKKTVA
ncbi:DUF418 domain-containing protein [Macrococcus animalis]|uniref:DUF418 domain-containing protein n=1 Tax=Macrococcus animalis TaxID=3395467 RepID=UPI0039BDF0C5